MRITAWWVLCGNNESDVEWCGPFAEEEHAQRHLPGLIVNDDEECHEVHKAVYGTVDPDEARICCDRTYDYERDRRAG